MNEMEISRAAAERSLREHMGNVVDALITLTNWELCAGCASVEKVKNMPLEGLFMQIMHCMTHFEVIK